MSAFNLWFVLPCPIVEILNWNWVVSNCFTKPRHVHSIHPQTAVFLLTGIQSIAQKVTIKRHILMQLHSELTLKLFFWKCKNCKKKKNWNLCRFKVWIKKPKNKLISYQPFELLALTFPGDCMQPELTSNCKVFFLFLNTLLSNEDSPIFTASTKMKKLCKFENESTIY